MLAHFARCVSPSYSHTCFHSDPKPTRFLGPFPGYCPYKLLGPFPGCFFSVFIILCCTFSILTPMPAQSSTVRALTSLPKSEAVAPRCSCSHPHGRAAPTTCRLKSPQSVRALAAELEGENPRKAKKLTFSGSSSCHRESPINFPALKPWENQQTLYIRSVNQDVSLDDG